MQVLFERLRGAAREKQLNKLTVRANTDAYR